MEVHFETGFSLAVFSKTTKVKFAERGPCSVGGASTTARNEGLVLCGCAHAARGTRALFREPYCRFLGKHSQTETGFKTNFLAMKGENSITSHSIVLTFKLVKI